ncbi:glutamate--tRNA ligase [Candidatus Woesearchaeota archaeon]|nr:glutamate--tRNA ligase [Candidatus Woesearchaeota archaeon]
MKKKASPLPAEKSGNILILKHALKNSLDFNGKANPKVVLGAVLKEDPSFKKDVPGLLKEIEKTIAEMEKFNPRQQQEKLQQLAPELLQKKEAKAEGPLKPLPNAIKGNVVVRIAPSPSGALHIGHAYGLCLNYEYAQMYNGKLILRIEDTNAENIYPQAYELIECDARWLTDNHLSDVIVQSSRLGWYYDQAEKLIQLDKAYVCTCDADQFKEMKNRGEACPCRHLSVKENQLRFEKMFGEYAEGEAVLRLKTDIQHKNPALRDYGLMRIVEHVHPKTKKEHRVWPLMVFAVAVDDHELGVTHVLNGKDHADNAIKEKIVMEYLGWASPEYKHWGKINFEGFELSTSKTRIAIEQGHYSGWDDIRLPFLPALRRRGYQSGAFRKFAVEIGLSLTDKTVSKEEFWKMINAFNKEIIEPKANRYFFIDDPVKVAIEGTPAEKVELDLHPDFPTRGKRTFTVKDEFFLAKSDLNQLEPNKIHRLMDCCNFTLNGTKYTYHSAEYEQYKNAPNKGHIIHWLPAQAKLKIDVMLDDGSTVSGLGEDSIKNINESEIVQLERRYFARLDKKESNKYTFWYLHK